MEETSGTTSVNIAGLPSAEMVMPAEQQPTGAASIQSGREADRQPPSDWQLMRDSYTRITVKQEPVDDSYNEAYPTLNPDSKPHSLTQNGIKAELNESPQTRISAHSNPRRSRRLRLKTEVKLDLSACFKKNCTCGTHPSDTAQPFIGDIDRGEPETRSDSNGKPAAGSSRINVKLETSPDGHLLPTDSTMHGHGCQAADVPVKTDCTLGERQTISSDEDSTGLHKNGSDAAATIQQQTSVSSVPGTIKTEPMDTTGVQPHQNHAHDSKCNCISGLTFDSTSHDQSGCNCNFQSGSDFDITKNSPQCDCNSTHCPPISESVSRKVKFEADRSVSLWNLLESTTTSDTKPDTLIKREALPTSTYDCDVLNPRKKLKTEASHNTQSLLITDPADSKASIVKQESPLLTSAISSGSQKLKEEPASLWSLFNSAGVAECEGYEQITIVNTELPQTKCECGDLNHSHAKLETEARTSSTYTLLKNHRDNDSSSPFVTTETNGVVSIARVTRQSKKRPAQQTDVDSVEDGTNSDSSLDLEDEVIGKAPPADDGEDDERCPRVLESPYSFSHLDEENDDEDGCPPNLGSPFSDYHVIEDNEEDERSPPNLGSPYSGFPVDEENERCSPNLNSPCSDFPVHKEDMPCPVDCETSDVDTSVSDGIQCSLDFNTSFPKSPINTGPKEGASDSPYLCKFCNSSFQKSTLLKLHIARYHEDNEDDLHFKIPTDINDAHNSKRMDVKKTHKKTSVLKSRNSALFVCKQCGKRFSQVSDFNMHKKTHSVLQSNVNDEKSRTNIVKRKNLKISGKSFTCEICKTVFPSASYLETHQSIHTNDKAYMCDVCGGTYSEAVDLYNHKIRTGHKAASLMQKKTSPAGKTYTCDVCEKSYSAAIDLYKHRIRTYHLPVLGRYKRHVYKHVSEEGGKSYSNNDSNKYKLQSNHKLLTDEKTQNNVFSKSRDRGQLTESDLNKYQMKFGQPPLKLRKMEDQSSDSLKVYKKAQEKQSSNHGTADNRHRAYSDPQKHKHVTSRRPIDVIRAKVAGKIFECEVCGKTFSQVSDLNKHKLSMNHIPVFSYNTEDLKERRRALDVTDKINSVTRDCKTNDVEKQILRSSKSTGRAYDDVSSKPSGRNRNEDSSKQTDRVRNENSSKPAGKESKGKTNRDGAVRNIWDVAEDLYNFPQKKESIPVTVDNDVSAVDYVTDVSIRSEDTTFVTDDMLTSSDLDDVPTDLLMTVDDVTSCADDVEANDDDPKEDLDYVLTDILMSVDDDTGDADVSTSADDIITISTITTAEVHNAINNVDDIINDLVMSVDDIPSCADNDDAVTNDSEGSITTDDITEDIHDASSNVNNVISDSDKSVDDIASTVTTNDITKVVDDVINHLVMSVDDVTNCTDNLHASATDITSTADDITEDVDDVMPLSVDDVTHPPNDVTTHTNDSPSAADDITDNTDDISNDNSKIISKSKGVKSNNDVEPGTVDFTTNAKTTNKTNNNASNADHVANNTNDISAISNISSNGNDITSNSNDIMDNSISSNSNDVTGNANDITSDVNDMTSNDITNKGNYITINGNDITSNDNDITSSSNEITSEENDIASNMNERNDGNDVIDGGNDITSNDTDITNSDNDITNDSNDITSNGNSTGYGDDIRNDRNDIIADNDIASKDTDITSNGNDIISNEITTNSNDITNNSGDATNITDSSTDITNDSDKARNTNDITNLANEANNITSNIDDLSINTGDITNNTGDTTSNTGDITNTDDITSITSDITNNTDNITNNTGDITNNTCDITNNADDLQSNSGNITDSIDDLLSNSGDTTNNTGDITNNTGDITNNAGDISSNSGDITISTDDSSYNTGDITSNTYDIKSNICVITNNTGVITSNNGDITVNKDDITDTTDDTSSKKDDITGNDDDIDTIDDITSNNGDITGNGDVIANDTASNNGDITGNDNDIADTIDDITSNKDNITGNHNDIKDTADDTVSKKDITSNDDDIAKTIDDITSNNGDIICNDDDMADTTDDITNHTDDTANNKVDITGNDDDDITDTGEDIASNDGNKNITSNTDDITDDTNDTTSNSNDLTNNTDDVTSNNDYITGNSDVITNNNDYITTNTDDTTSSTDDITSDTNNITSIVGIHTSNSSNTLTTNDSEMISAYDSKRVVSKVPMFCHVCDKRFAEADDFKSHREHTGHIMCRCACGYTCKSDSTLTDHMQMCPMIVVADSDSVIKKMPFCCRVCGKCYAQVENFKSHSQHTGHNLFECACGRMCKNASELDVHIERCRRIKFKADASKKVENVVNTLPFCCHVCGKGFHQAEDFKSHSQHTGHNQFECACGVVCTRTSEFNSHKERCQMINADASKNVVSTRSFCCNVCGKGFHQAEDFISHSQHTGHKQFECACGVVCKCASEFNSHTCPYTWFVCKVCGQKWNEYTDLQNHILQTGHISFICETCGEGFCKVEELEDHQIVHRPEMFVCDVCTKGHATLTDLIRHKNLTRHRLTNHVCLACKAGRSKKPSMTRKSAFVHTCANKISCDVCDLAFSSLKDLENHRVKTKHKPHMCNMCGKAFLLACDLDTHKLTHAGSGKRVCMSCTACNKQFYIQGRLMAHFEKVHGKCEHCPERFFSLQDLKKHRQDVHDVL